MTPAILATVVLYALLLRLAVIDLATYRLPDRLTLPLIAAGLAWSAWDSGGWPVAAMFGAALGYGVFAAVGWAFFRLRGVEGLGLGDAKLLAAAGAWLGPLALPWVVLGAAGGALAAVAAGLLDRSGRIAFGPWIALAIAVIWAAGPWM